jgi:murein DD-endopeptidase MepM/ murein hydrolase activator NlpD
MLRKLLTSLFCSLLLAAQSYSQDVFVPRELKAQAVHPVAVKEHATVETKAPKKEVVRRAQPVTEADLRAEVTTAKTDKAPAKEKSSATVRVEKAPAAREEPASKTVAKTDTPKTEPSKEKEKVAAVKEKPATVKVEKAIPVKQEPATKAVAKNDTAKPDQPKEKAEKPAVVKEKSVSDSTAKAPAVKNEAATAKAEKKDDSSTKHAAKTESVKVETVTAKTEKAPAKDKPAVVAAARTQKDEKTPPAKEESVNKTVAKTETVKTEPATPKVDKPSAVKEKPANVTAKTQLTKTEAVTAKVETPRPPAEGPITVAKTTTMKVEQVSVPSQKDPPQIIPAMTTSLETGLTKIADGFDFPVGKPDAEGYYKARGFRSGGHVGEDWDGTRGGDTDLKDPIFSIGDGIVVFARDVHLGWGNVIIVRHAYRENGMVKYVDALYGHLNTMLVGRGQKVSRGQQIATMGTAHGQYDAHLHFEIRKNLEIGMSRSKFQKSFSNYYDPSQFIASHRRLSGGGANYKVAMNTFTHDWTYRFDSNRNFSARKRSTGESSAALRRAVTSR